MKRERQTSPGKTARIFIVDDHPVIRTGIAVGIGQEPDLAVCGEANSVRSALREIVRLQPDLVTSALTFPQRDGLELIKLLRARNYTKPILIISVHDAAVYAERALRAGACGYIMKTAPVAAVIAGIRRGLAGEIEPGNAAIAQVLQRVTGAGTRVPPVNQLSEPELAMLCLMGGKLERKAIVTKLAISGEAFDKLRHNLRVKLAIRKTSELQRFAVEFTRANAP